MILQFQFDPINTLLNYFNESVSERVTDAVLTSDATTTSQEDYLFHDHSLPYIQFNIK